MKSQWGCPPNGTVKALDCRIVISEFQLLYSLSDKYPWEKFESRLCLKLWVN